jgi:hypothetical protein
MQEDPSPKSELLQGGESTQPLDQSEDKPTIAETFDTMFRLQSQLIAGLEQQVQTFSAQVEAAQHRLPIERTLLYLLARCEAGLLDDEQQQMMWKMMDDPKRSRGLDPAMSHLYSKASEEANTIAVAPPVLPKPSNGLQDEIIKPTDDLI